MAKSPVRGDTSIIKRNIAFTSKMPLLVNTPKPFKKKTSMILTQQETLPSTTGKATFKNFNTITSPKLEKYNKLNEDSTEKSGSLPQIKT